ncbi:MAG: glycosyltransferase family 2 protein, partial [Bacteroidales bacterium]
EREIPILSIVVPCYNEEETIEACYNELTKVLQPTKYNYELIFVNDGSKDRTLEKLVKLHKLDPRVKIIDLSRNFGKEIALSAGLDYTKGDAVIPFDADLQDPPQAILELIEKYKEGYDVVNAVRSKRDGETWLKKATASLFYKIINKFSSVKLPANVGDFRLLSRPVVDVIKKLPERRRFMKGLVAWVGFKTATIYYERQPRFAGKTKWNYLKLFNFAIEGITSFSIVPLQVASFVGVLVSLFSFIYAAYIFIQKIVYGNPVPGYPSLMIAILFLGGIELIVLGIIGEYIGRIYEESKHRPLYIIKNMWDKEKL